MSPASEPLPARIERALGQLKGQDERTVLGAIHALAAIGEPVLPALVEALGADEARLRCGAARALGYLRSKSGVPPLLAALTDADRRVREAAARSLGWVGDEAALPGLIEVLGDSDEDVREKAAVALRDLGSMDAMPALEAALEDESHWVRRAARKSIWKLQELHSKEDPPP